MEPRNQAGFSHGQRSTQRPRSITARPLCFLFPIPYCLLSRSPPNFGIPKCPRRCSKSIGLIIPSITIRFTFRSFATSNDHPSKVRVIHPHPDIGPRRIKRLGWCYRNRRTRSVRRSARNSLRRRMRLFRHQMVPSPIPILRPHSLQRRRIVHIRRRVFEVVHSYAVQLSNDRTILIRHNLACRPQHRLVKRHVGVERCARRQRIHPLRNQRTLLCPDH
jgi:hypothetical protein